MKEFAGSVAEVLGITQDEAEQRMQGAETSPELLVMTQQGDFRFGLGGWANHLERLRARFTGDERHLAWQNHPQIIDSMLPGTVVALLSKPDDAGLAALAAAVAVNSAGDLIRTRFVGVVVAHGPIRTRAHIVHRPLGKFM